MGTETWPEKMELKAECLQQAQNKAVSRALSPKDVLLCPEIAIIDFEGRDDKSTELVLNPAY